jgi:hypothetical protein
MAPLIEIPEVTSDSTRKRESTITKKCLKWVNTLPRTHCEKRAGGPNRKGKPDITGATHGIRIEIEMKAPGQNPTPIQMQHLTAWESIGCIAGWVDNLEEFKAMIRTGLARRGIHLNNKYFIQEV